MPHPDDIEILAHGRARICSRVRSQAYDLVLNGWELGSGSVRIHRPDLQQQIFSLLGITEDEAQSRFGFLLDAFRYGAPPHAGFAFGIDRLVAVLDPLQLRVAPAGQRLLPAGAEAAARTRTSCWRRSARTRTRRSAPTPPRSAATPPRPGAACCSATRTSRGAAATGSPSSSSRSPGQYDVAGACLIGSPVVNIGWNKDVAWSHTVSTAYRFTPYEYQTAARQPHVVPHRRRRRSSSSKRDVHGDRAEKPTARWRR